MRIRHFGEVCFLSLGDMICWEGALFEQTGEETGEETGYGAEMEGVATGHGEI